jgi:hypothetical protein
MASMSEEEIERLANRLAMLVSDNGEADNAGRAVGALARRLGLSGGQLKAIFVAGAESAGNQTARLAEQDRRIARLEREILRLRDALADAEAVSWSIKRERDLLREEARQLQGRVDRHRAGLRGKLIAVVLAVVAIGAIAAGGIYGSGLLGPQGPSAGDNTPVYRTAVVRDRDVILREQPDAGSPGVATLPVGTRMPVRRLLWRDLQQWVEVEAGGRIGYVPSTAVDLS